MGWYSKGRWCTKDYRPYSHGTNENRERFFDYFLFCFGGATHGHVVRTRHAEKTSSKF